MRALTLRIVAAALTVVPAAAGATGADAGADEPRSFTLAMTGDILVTETVRRVADANEGAPGDRVHDFTPMLAGIEPWIAEADFAVCHVETPLLPRGSNIRPAATSLPFPQFVAPADLTDALVAVGFDACSTAANHSLDYGFAGLTATLDALEAAGLGHSGTARSAAEDHPALYDVNGVTVAHAAYTFGTNKVFVDDPWAVNYLDLDEMLADAAWARAAGAEFVVFSVHWGKDYTVMPSERQLEHAVPLMESGLVDLIVGHHSHVVQPVAEFDGRYVVYGLGNQLSNIRSNVGVATAGSEDGIIAHFEVAEQPDGSFAVEGFSVTPTRVLPTTMEVVAVEHDLAYGPASRAGEMRRSLEMTLDRLGRLGHVPRTTPIPWPALSCAGRLATIIGTVGDDVLVGTSGDDVMVGRGGDDAIWGGGGDDLICAGAGDDYVGAGPGGDEVWAGDGDDLVLGQDGDDVLWGEDGDDLLSGLGGEDLLIGGSGDDALLGGEGDDLLWAGGGSDRAGGGPGDDQCRAAAATECES